MNNPKLLENLRCIPDFPKKWINFRDVTTLYKDSECLKIIVDELYEHYKDKWITKVVWIESRWFVVAAALAYKLWAWVVLARKPWKLPAETLKQSYMKEYWPDTIEIHKDAIEENDTVLIHDDLLATWWSMKATYDLVKTFNPKRIFINFIIEITDEWLHWRDVFDKDIEITTLLNL